MSESYWPMSLVSRYVISMALSPIAVYIDPLKKKLLVGPIRETFMLISC